MMTAYWAHTAIWQHLSCQPHIITLYCLSSAKQIYSTHYSCEYCEWHSQGIAIHRRFCRNNWVTNDDIKLIMIKFFLLCATSSVCLLISTHNSAQSWPVISYQSLNTLQCARHAITRRVSQISQTANTICQLLSGCTEPESSRLVLFILWTQEGTEYSTCHKAGCCVKVLQGNIMLKCIQVVNLTDWTNSYYMSGVPNVTDKSSNWINLQASSIININLIHIIISWWVDI